MRRLVLFVMAVMFVVACGPTKGQLAREAEQKQEKEAAAKARQDLYDWYQANKHVVTDDVWTVQGWRASHILIPAKPGEPGNPGLGSVAGGGTAALLGATPGGVVLGGVIGASLSDGTAAQAGVDAATCILFGEKPTGEEGTFVFHAKQNPEWAGICLALKVGDTFNFKKTIERSWHDDGFSYRVVHKVRDELIPGNRK